jgi:hypothetical protein
MKPDGHKLWLYRLFITFIGFSAQLVSGFFQHPSHEFFDPGHRPGNYALYVDRIVPLSGSHD